MAATQEAAPATASPQNPPVPGPKITLHWLEKSRAQRILWLLEELHLDYELKTYKRGKDFLAGPELKEVHPLGKSPVIGIKPVNGAEFVVAESGLIVEYITEHFGGWLIPARWKPGQENQVGAETDEWLRYRFLMHYAEGSLMSLMILGLVALNIKKAPAPFFAKPIVRRVADGLNKMFLNKNFTNHFAFIEQQLKTSGGDFICGRELTGADVLMIFPLEAALQRKLFDPATHPAIKGYVERLLARPAYQRAVQKIKDATGGYDAVIS